MNSDIWELEHFRRCSLVSSLHWHIRRLITKTKIISLDNLKRLRYQTTDLSIPGRNVTRHSEIFKIRWSDLTKNF